MRWLRSPQSRFSGHSAGAWRIGNHAGLKEIGGFRVSGRCHLAGRPVAYLAEHPAGALLETLVHQQIGSVGLPDTYGLLRVEVGDVTIAELDEGALPEGWRQNQSWMQASGTDCLTVRGAHCSRCRALSYLVPITTPLTRCMTRRLAQGRHDH
jgi:RES domain-containing protein